MTDRPLNLKKLRGESGSMPIHVDILVSGERELSPLSYRIFFSHEKEDLLNEVARRVKDGHLAYPPYLGTANNLAYVRFVDLVEAKIYRAKGEVEICTVIPISVVGEVKPQTDRKIFIEELVQADFTSDRQLSRRENYIYEGEGKPIKVVVDAEVFTCTVEGMKVAGVFM